MGLEMAPRHGTCREMVCRLHCPIGTSKVRAFLGGPWARVKVQLSLSRSCLTAAAPEVAPVLLCPQAHPVAGLAAQPAPCSPFLPGQPVFIFLPAVQEWLDWSCSICSFSMEPKGLFLPLLSPCPSFLSPPLPKSNLSQQSLLLSTRTSRSSVSPGRWRGDS